MATAAQSIRVVEGTTVAGTRHVPAMAAIAEGYGKGERFALVRDAANPHDGWAVEVRDGADRRIGYVSWLPLLQPPPPPRPAPRKWAGPNAWRT